ncbi:MAG: hypothetical protein EBT12_14955 [Marivivens sp.]|nr:hypothetical protein [Marivivens sp.]
MFNGKGDTTQLEADAARYGVILEPHHLKPPEFRLWAELWPAVDLFMRCHTQWRAGPGGLIGLDYPAVLQIAAIAGVAVDAAIMEDIQVMELHARTLINSKTGGS